MLLQQLKVAFVPLVMVLVCGVGVVFNWDRSDGAEGSAISGYARGGKYFLSMGHGYFSETSRAEFEAIRRRERVVFVCLAGMVISGIGCGIAIGRAGLPGVHKRRLRIRW